MKLYKFSPIQNKKELFQALAHIHYSAYNLSQKIFGKHFENSGNIGVFCHYQNEYENLIRLREEMTIQSENFNQKYFKLIEPIIFEAKDKVPTIKYDYLYIRKPDPYRHHVGDIDFYLQTESYQKLKADIINNSSIQGARVFDRADLDMIELYDPDFDDLAYISTLRMVERVRVKQ